MTRLIPILLLSALLVAAGVVAASAVGSADPPPRIAFVARGDGTNFADALAVGSIAGQLAAPVFTTDRDRLPAATAAGLAARAPELVVITGGAGAVSEAVRQQVVAATGLSPEQVVRAAGDDRFATAAQIAELLATLDVNPAFLPLDGVATAARHADTATSADHAATAGTATAAEDADTLDGLDSTAFARAEGVVLTYQHGWTQGAGQAGSASVDSTTGLLTFTGGANSEYFLDLGAPTALGGQAHRLSSMEVCYQSVDAGGVIDRMRVRRFTDDPAPDVLFEEGTNQQAIAPAVECLQIVPDDHPAVPAAYLLELQIDGDVRLIRTTATFSP